MYRLVFQVFTPHTKQSMGRFLDFPCSHLSVTKKRKEGDGGLGAEYTDIFSKNWPRRHHPSYVPNRNELRYANTLTTSENATELNNIQI